MLENITPPKQLPKVKDRDATIYLRESLEEGKVLDVNPTFIMLQRDEEYVIVPWDKIQKVIVDVPKE